MCSVFGSTLHVVTTHPNLHFAGHTSQTAHLQCHEDEGEHEEQFTCYSVPLSLSRWRFCCSRRTPLLQSHFIFSSLLSQHCLSPSQVIIHFTSFSIMFCSILYYLCFFCVPFSFFRPDDLPLHEISDLYLLDFVGPPGFVQEIATKVPRYCLFHFLHSGCLLLLQN